MGTEAAAGIEGRKGGRGVTSRRSDKRVAPARSTKPVKPAKNKNPLDVAMGKEFGFKKGHRLWEYRVKSNAPPKIFDTPEDLWIVATKYFEWVDANPIYEAKLINSGLDHELVPVPKMRAMSVRAFCVFAGFSQDSWYKWRLHRVDLQPMIDVIECVIFAQKFEGAAAGLFNAVIIARDLGLADRSELSGPDGKPIRTERGREELSEEELAEELAKRGLPRDVFRK